MVLRRIIGTVLAMATFAAAIHCACAGILEGQPAARQESHACCRHPDRNDHPVNQRTPHGRGDGCAHCQSAGILARTNDAKWSASPAGPALVPTLSATPAVAATALSQATQSRTSSPVPTAARTLLEQHCALTL
jgi:hypothetical protein